MLLSASPLKTAAWSLGHSSHCFDVKFRSGLRRRGCFSTCSSLRSLVKLQICIWKLFKTWLSGTNQKKKLQQWWKRSRNIQGECFLWGEQPDLIKYGILFLISEHQDCTLYNTQGPGWMKDPRGWKLLRHLHCGGIILWDCAKKV